MLSLVVFATIVISACQNESIPDTLYPFQGMIRLASDTLYFVDCDLRELQWVAGGTALDEMIEQYKQSVGADQDGVYMVFQGAIVERPAPGQNTVERVLTAYVLDSVREHYTCLPVNAYAAAGKYTTRGRTTQRTLVLGFNGRAQLLTKNGNTIREPGTWQAIDSTTLQLVLNETDTLTGALDWQLNITLTGESLPAPVLLSRE